LSYPEPENVAKTKHACPTQQDLDPDELSGIASEIESRSKHVKDVPEGIKHIILEHPKVFKTDLDPSDHIDLAKIPGYSKYEEGIKIEVQPGAKPVANTTMRQIPLHYAGKINGMYQELVLPNEVCEWVSPSRVVVKTSSAVENPQLRIVSDLRSLNTFGWSNTIFLLVLVCPEADWA
jgi:hypothetical protein